jgi:aminopeptidase N
MRRLFVSFLVLNFVLVSCTISQAPATPTTAPATPTTTPPSDIFDTPWEDRSIFKTGLVSPEQSTLNELPDASVYHLEFNLEEDLYHVTGTEEVRYTNAEEIPLDQVQLRLFPNILGGEMTIANLTVDEQSVTPSYELENSLLRVRFSTPLEPGQSVIIKMDFAITIPQTLEQNYGVLAYVEDVLTLAHAYPMIAVYDEEGWNAEIPPPSGDVTYADAAFFIVKVTAPNNLTLVASGQQISSSEAERVQMLSVVSGPARDFYLVASPTYEKITETFGEVTVNTYAPENFQKGSEMALDVASRAIEVFSTRYAAYPYKELDIVATPTLALGIEYPGMIAITSRIYDLDQNLGSAPASDYMEATVAHEVGHQWFYNLVGNDQLDDPWLDEALTQFATLEYYADEYGPQGEQAFRYSLEARWHSVNNGADIPIGLPVSEYSGQEYSGIVYGRGPLFFVELREEMGTEAFDAFIKEYTETLSWDIATPEFLQSLAEKHCSCDLDALFNEWVYP